jgi:hypothetical protein
MVVNSSETYSAENTHVSDQPQVSEAVIRHNKYR